MYYALIVPIVTLPLMGCPAERAEKQTAPRATRAAPKPAAPKPAAPKPAAPKPAAPRATRHAPKPANPPQAMFQVVTLKNKGDFQAMLQAEVNKARALKLDPYLEFTADWCKPCVAFKKHLSDPLMTDALTGTYIIMAEFDVWHKEARSMSIIGVPTWVGLDEKAKPNGRRINSNVWGEDIPKNMAPPLKRFFGAGKSTG